MMEFTSFGSHRCRQGTVYTVSRVGGEEGCSGPSRDVTDHEPEVPAAHDVYKRVSIRRPFTTLFTLLLLLPAAGFAGLGDSPEVNARKMGPPQSTAVRTFTDFPKMTYAVAHTPRGWLPVSSLMKKAEKASEAKDLSQLKRIRKQVENAWGVLVVYVDGKSCCEVWMPFDGGESEAVTLAHARLVLKSYKAGKKWTRVDDDTMTTLANKFASDLYGKTTGEKPQYMLKPSDGSAYYVVDKNAISIFTSDYPDRIRPARIAGKKKQKKEDDAFIKGIERSPLVLLDWHWKTEHGYAIAEGQILNVSGRQLDRVQALVIYKTEAGELITSDSAMVEYQPIMPGQTSPFKVHTTENPQMKTASVSFKALLGGSLGYMTKKEYEKAKAILDAKEEDH